MSEVNTNADLIAAAQAAKAEAKAKRDAEKAAAKEQTAAQKEAAKAEKEAAKAAKLQAKADAKAAKEAAKAAKEQAKLDAKAEKDSTRQPEQNGVRRPGPDGKCGRVWALADELSAQLGQAVPIANLLEAANAEGLTASNVRCEYARWKKFHGLSGRIVMAPAASE